MPAPLGPDNLSLAFEVAALRKGLDYEKLMGKAALSLIEAAGSAAVDPSPSPNRDLGRLIDVRA